MARYNIFFDFAKDPSKNSLLASKVLSVQKDNKILRQLAEIFFESPLFFINSMFSQSLGYWKFNESLNDPQIIQKLVGKAGIKLPTEVFSDGFMGELMKNAQEALDRGAFATPCFYIDPLQKYIT